MTEQQIKYLQEVLDRSNLEPNSVKLDSTILRASHEHTEAAPEGVEAKSLLGFLAIDAHLGAFGVASAAIGLTVVMLLALSFLVDTNKFRQPANVDTQLVIELMPQSAELNIVEPVASGIVSRPDDSFTQATPHSESELLKTDLVLPNTEELLKELDYALPQHQRDARNAISLAMNDIRRMLDGGRIENAKDRYEELVENCDVCILPATLEALVYTGKHRTDRG